jgi:hypothetical protein
MQVVLIRGASAYGALGLFTERLAAAFSEHGYSPAIVDATAQDLEAALRRIAAQGPVALAFSFGLFGEFRTPDGLSVGDLAEAPHVIHYVDYPLSHALRLDRTPRSAAILVVDATHVEAIEATYGQDHFAFVGFCPHAAIGPVSPACASAADFAAERPVPTLFAGTLYPPQAPAWTRFASPVRELFEAAFEIALAQDALPALDALRAALRDRGLDPAAPEHRDVRRGATFVHEQVRAVRRLRLLETAARMGIPLWAVGKGYEAELGRFPNLTYGGETDLAGIVSLMRHSRVVLNVNANFGAGSHERVFSAMAAGAAAASDHSRFYAERFEAGSEILLYRWTALEEGLEQVARLAADPDAAWALAEAGRARTAAEHQWAHRVDVILEAADAARARRAAA